MHYKGRQIMKTFYASIILFIITVSLIVLNYSYISNLSEKLTEMTENLPSPSEEGCYKAVEDLYAFWEKNHDIARISTGYIELNKISDAITSLKVYAANNSISDFENTRELLYNAIDELHRLESFSFYNIY